MQHRCYADDTQMYLTVERDEPIVATEVIFFFQAKQRDSLGVLFDSNLKMEHLIANTVQLLLSD